YVDGLVSVQDVRRPGYVGFGHANRQHDASRFDRTAVNGCFILLNVASEKPMPQSGLAKLVARQSQSLAVNHADLTGRKARSFQVTPGSLGMTFGVVECYLFFVMHCFSFPPQ